MDKQIEIKTKAATFLKKLQQRLHLHLIILTFNKRDAAAKKSSPKTGLKSLFVT